MGIERGRNLIKIESNKEASILGVQTVVNLTFLFLFFLF